MAGKAEMERRADDWLAANFTQLQATVDRSVGVLTRADATNEEVAAAERRLKAAGTAARTIKSIAALVKGMSAAQDEAGEGEGEGEDDGDDDDPVELARERAELHARVSRLRATVDAARASGWPLVTESDQGVGRSNPDPQQIPTRP